MFGHVTAAVETDIANFDKKREVSNKQTGAMMPDVKRSCTAVLN